MTPILPANSILGGHFIVVHQGDPSDLWRAHAHWESGISLLICVSPTCPKRTFPAQTGILSRLKFGSLNGPLFPARLFYGYCCCLLGTNSFLPGHGADATSCDKISRLGHPTYFYEGVRLLGDSFYLGAICFCCFRRIHPGRGDEGALALCLQEDRHEDRHEDRQGVSSAIPPSMCSRCCAFVLLWSSLLRPPPSFLLGIVLLLLFLFWSSVVEDNR